MTLVAILILIICGVFTNLLSALFGIGGGVLMVPILHSLFPELPLQMVAATSLTIVMASALINLSYFYKQKIKVNIKSLLCWSLFMIVGVQLGFESSFLLPDSMIVMVFVATLLILAVRTFLAKDKKQNEESQENHYIRGGMVSLFGGTIAGITGIGGGSIMAPLIASLPSVKAHQIAIYTNYMMVIGGIGSLYGYLTKPAENFLANSWQIGHVNFTLVLIVIASSFCTSFFSMKLRGLLSPTLTRKLLALTLFSIGCYMLGLHYLG
ncbi:hypothetical protein A1D22_08365 [Pasteurellaceae bacterium LFhippo2]|nr:hypothetical protein [Pasteurellaceae bacterium LFhippo2]